MFEVYRTAKVTINGITISMHEGSLVHGIGFATRAEANACARRWAKKNGRSYDVRFVENAILEVVALSDTTTPRISWMSA